MVVLMASWRVEPAVDQMVIYMAAKKALNVVGKMAVWREIELVVVMGGD